MVGSIKSTHQLGEESAYAHAPKNASIANPGRNSSSLIPNEISCLSKAYKNDSLFHLPICLIDLLPRFLTLQKIVHLLSPLSSSETSIP